MNFCLFRFWDEQNLEYNVAVMEHSEPLFRMSSPRNELSVSVRDAKPFLLKCRHTWQQLLSSLKRCFYCSQTSERYMCRLCWNCLIFNVHVWITSWNVTFQYFRWDNFIYQMTMLSFVCAHPSHFLSSFSFRIKISYMQRHKWEQKIPAREEGHDKRQV